MSKFLNEFKKFAVQGNMLDMAVGMIIGAAFKDIVNSVVNDLIMPVVSMFTGKVDFANMFIVGAYLFCIHKLVENVIEEHGTLFPGMKMR